MKQPITIRSDQNGAVLLLMAIGLFTLILGGIVSAFSVQTYQLKANQNVRHSLAEAKDSLLAFVILSDIYSTNPLIGPGNFVCPDMNNDGVADSSCLLTSTQLFPEQVKFSTNTYTFSTPLNNNSQKLWYAISNNFNISKSTPVNTNTLGTFTLNDEKNIVSLLIHPGDALNSQIRPSNNIDDFLEKENTKGPNFLNGESSSDSINDQILAISHSELMTLLTSRIAGIIKTTLDDLYSSNGNKYLTQAQFQNLALGAWPQWFSANHWQQPSVTIYTPLSTDIIELSFSNCNLIYTLDQSLAVIAKRASFSGHPLHC